jgi:glycosyltransferase involved in cell wall biosynthesis
MRGVTSHKGSWRVGLDAHLLSLTQTYRAAGINGYIYELLNRLPALSQDEPALELVAYLHEAAFRPPVGLQVVRSRWDTSNPWRRILWEQTALVRHSRSLDLLHAMAFAVPLAAACPTVVTVHDLSFIRFPDAFRPLNRMYLTALTRVSVKRAQRVIVGAESTRRDVIELCSAQPERVVIVPYGVTGAFSPAPPDAVAAFRQRKGLPERFILFLGTLEPRKNIGRLIEAYATLRARRANGTETPKLVIAGAKGWHYERLFTRVTELGLTEDILFAGYVAAEDLPWWYRAASLFVFPSLFEGFGLPVLEAMACGTPTITSNVSSLPEVAGDAAILVDPYDQEGLASAMERVLNQPDLARELSVAGVRQAQQFPWSRTAAETAAVYRMVLHERHGRKAGSGPGNDGEHASTGTPQRSATVTRRVV